MFGKSQEPLIEALTRIQRFHCAYDAYRDNSKSKPPNLCDCKYGADRLDNRDEQGNGCPELRSAIWILSAMTSEEYAEIAKRGHVEIMTGKKMKRILEVDEEEPF